MCGDNLVLGQHPVNWGTQGGAPRLLRCHPEDVLEREVGHDALADPPIHHGVADRDDLARHVGARDEVILLPARVLALGDGEVAVLHRQQRGQVQSNTTKMWPQSEPEGKRRGP